MRRDDTGRLWASLQNIDRPGRPGAVLACWLTAASAAIAMLGLAFTVPVSAAAWAGGGLAAGRAAATVSGGWGEAREIPGTASLNGGGEAHVWSVSCASPGNCTAGGFYTGATHGQQAFVVTQKNGIWGTAEQVPGLASLNAGEDASVGTVSCTSAGNCSASGYYNDSAFNFHGFVVTQANGVWGTAEQVPGVGGGAGSLSCSSAGNCTVGGSDHGQAIVVTQKNGIWGKAKEVPGIASLNVGGGAGVSVVSCASAGNCSAGGTYHDANGNGQVFVVTKKNGAWGTAKQIPGTASLNKGGDGRVSAVSCASAGNCTLGGLYFDDGYNYQSFVITQKNGTWGTAIEVPGTEHFASYDTGIGSLSCATAGNCSAGGTYLDSGHVNRAWVVTQKNGVWGQAEDVPGTGPEAVTLSVSCGSAGNCSAAGYRFGQGYHAAFVVNEANGIWGTASLVPGTASLNTGGDAEVNSVSCAKAYRCSAVGDYTDSAGHYQVFAVTRR